MTTQAYIGGAKGTALDKPSKRGGPDARPICSGEALRRVVGKALLATELDTLREHLLAHQLAVGVPAGAEVLPHVACLWQHDFRGDPNRVLLTFDEGNAHNEVDRHAFLTRMRELCPGLSRWLEYISPTNSATSVFCQILPRTYHPFTCRGSTRLPLDDGLPCRGSSSFLGSSRLHPPS